MYLLLTPVTTVGQEEAPYFTSGQFDSAAAMDIIAGQINAQFVVTLGDNFYYNGVKDVASHRFQSTFEDVYTGAVLTELMHIIVLT